MLHLLKTSTGGSWALRQMRELVKLGVDVHVALPAGGPLIPEYVAAGVCVHLDQFDFPVRAPWRFPEVARQLRELVRDTEPDLIHSHFVGTTLTMRLGLGRSHPTPRLFQVPGPLHLESPLFRAAEIASAGSPDYWIATCEWTQRRYIRSGVPQSKVFLSYYCPDAAAFDPAAHSTGTLRKELGLAPGTRVVGTVAYFYAPKWFLGQFRGIKGHELLIDAMSLVLRQVEDCRCVMIGGSYKAARWYEEMVRRYARRRCGAKIIFLGERADVPDLLVDFDVAVTPSRSENFGGTGESLLLGIPTIGTAVGGIPDLVESEKTGWLVPPNCPRDLAAAIVDALVQPAKARRLSEEGRARVKRIYDQAASARTVLHIYEGLAPGEPPAAAVGGRVVACAAPGSPQKASAVRRAAPMREPQ